MPILNSLVYFTLDYNQNMASIQRSFFLFVVVFCASNFLYIIIQSDQLVLTMDQVGLGVRELSLLNETLHEGESGATMTTQPIVHHKTTSNPSLRINGTTTTKPEEELFGWQQHYQWKSELDQHEYRYLINPENICKKSANVGENRRKSANITLVVLVKTRIDSRDRRDEIRESYGKAVVEYNVSAVVVFLVGTTNETNTTKEALLQQEAKAYGDILQEDFADSYLNLTVKLIMGFKWASTFCTNAQFVMSTDDDVVLDIVNLANDLGNVSSEFRSKFALAEPCIDWGVPRNNRSKWYTPPSLYSKEIWPPFPRGYAYVVSKDVGYEIYRESQKFAPLAPWDDVYCGFLLQRIGVEMKDMKTWFFKHQEKQHAPLRRGNHYAIFEFGRYSRKMYWHAIEGRYRNIHKVSGNN